VKQHSAFYGVCYFVCSKYSKSLTFLNCWRKDPECISYRNLQ